MVARALAGFIHGQRVRMFTLTAPASDTVERSYDELARRWNRFREQLRRDFPGMRFEYFKVTERQARGHAHLHVLCRGGFIPQRWLSASAAKAGFGFVADIRQVGKKAAKYVGKYLAKEMGTRGEALGFPPLPRWHRRASWSRNWAPAFQASWQRWMQTQQLLGFSWWISNSPPAPTAYRLGALGYDLVEIDVGHQQELHDLLDRADVCWRSASATHRPCWLCERKHPARRWRHTPEWEPIPSAPPLVLTLWAAL